jgi:molybdopterin converting factor small subunit
VKLEVRLFASLRDRFPPSARGRESIELAPGASLQDLLDYLAIADHLAQMVLVDGRQAPRPRTARAALPLEEGQTVSIFPPVAGG